MKALQLASNSSVILRIAVKLKTKQKSKLPDQGSRGKKEKKKGWGGVGKGRGGKRCRKRIVSESMRLGVGAVWRRELLDEKTDIQRTNRLRK